MINWLTELSLFEILHKQHIMKVRPKADGPLYVSQAKYLFLAAIVVNVFSEASFTQRLILFYGESIWLGDQCLLKLEFKVKSQPHSQYCLLQ